MRIAALRELDIRISTPTLIIILIIIQSCGIRFFDGQGSVLTALILGLCRSAVKHLGTKDFVFFFVVLVFLLLSTIINPSFDLSKVFFQFSTVLEVYLFLLLYKNNTEKLLNDFYSAIAIIFVHSVVGFFLFLVLPVAFNYTKAFGYPYRTLGYLFYVTEPLYGPARNTGILWEPGLLQLLLNIFLFYSIKRDKPIWILALIVITIITTFSTTGYITLALNYMFFIFWNYKGNKKAVTLLVICSFLFSSVILLLTNNIGEKFNGENTSGLTRYRDYLIGIELIKEKPLLGHGLFERSYLTAKSYVREIETGLYTEDYLAISDEMAGGYTNGLLGFITWYGLPVSCLVYFLLFKNNFVGDKLFERGIFFVIVVFALFSEPITYTSFFLVFPFSAFLLGRDKVLCKKNNFYK